MVLAAVMAVGGSQRPAWPGAQGASWLVLLVLLLASLSKLARLWVMCTMHVSTCVAAMQGQTPEPCSGHGSGSGGGSSSSSSSISNTTTATTTIPGIVHIIIVIPINTTRPGEADSGSTQAASSLFPE